MTAGRTLTFSKPADRVVLIGIAIIPTLDCVLNQVSNALHIKLGAFSVLQAVRGALVVVFALIIVSAIVRNAACVGRIPMPAVGACVLLAMAASKEVVATGSLSMESAGAYGQMLYWVMLWTTVSIVCRRPVQGEIILRGLAWGACLTAISVFLGLFFGATEYYSNDSVHSSAGWFDTAKMITGLLVVGGVVILYLGREHRGWLSCFGAGLCFSACVVTYARAGTVALVVVVLWLFVWRISIAKANSGRWLNRFLGMALVACLLVPAVVNVQSLLARWSDVGDTDRGGSGRATFWRIAVDAYASEEPSEQIFGAGYRAMSEMLFRNYGDDIKHTHNDLLDLLLVSGFVGALWFVSLISALVRRALMPAIGSVQGAVAVAIVLTYLCHGFLTGQIWGTDSMTYYTLGLTCLMRLAGDKSPAEVIQDDRISHPQPLIEA